MTEETIVGVATAYSTGKPGSTVIVIPKDAQKKIGAVRGKKFLVKTDDQGRIIYEPIKEE